MVKVLPIEESRITTAEGQEGVTAQPSNGVTAAVRQEGPPLGQPTNRAIAGISAVEEAQQLGDDVVSNAAKAGPDASGGVMSQPETHAAGVDGPSNALDSSVSVSDELLADAASAVADHSSQGASSTTLDMEKHSGMTTFSLMRHSDESSLDGPGRGPATHAEQEHDAKVGGEEKDEEEKEEEQEEEEEGEPEPVVANFGRRGTRKFVRQDTKGGGFGNGMLGGEGKDKKAPFHVPQTMYMGHPVGSPAAEFVERQQHRLAQVKTRREEVAGLLKLVMDHNPKSSGSGLPNVDAVFPYMRGRENDQQGDRYT